jgi:hypothetical protein
MIKGSPSMPLADITLDPEQRSNLLALIPSDLRCQLHIQDLLIQCASALTRNGLQTMSKEQEETMESIVQDYLSRLELIETESPRSEYSKSVSRLIMYAFHFYQAPDHWTRNSLLISQMLFHAAHALEVHEQDKASPASARTWYSVHGLLQVNCILFRIYKTPGAATAANGQDIIKTLYRGIALLKEMTIDPMDLPARAADIFTQLLVSTKVFIHPASPPDKPRVVPLRIRSRMGMGHLLDLWVWWREEFGGYSGLYPTPIKDTQPQNCSSTDQLTRVTSIHGNGEQNESTNVPQSSTIQNGTTSAGGPIHYSSSGYQSNLSLDPLQFTNNDPFLPDDIFADVWSYWPDEDWGIRGLT